MNFLRKANKQSKSQKGFTLIELLAVMGILGILSGLVTGAVGGISQKGQLARLEADKNSIGNASDQYLNESFPQGYPIVSLANTDASLLTAGDMGVRLLDFDARLPGDPTKTFVPDFLKEIPKSSALVSWRLDTNRGLIFFTQDGSQLIPPSDTRLNVTAGLNQPGSLSNYTINMKVKKNQAALNSLKIEVPKGYILGGQNLPQGVTIGSLKGSFAGDNPWDLGQTITFNGVLQSTGSANEWVVKVNYDTNTSSSGLRDVDVKNTGATIRSHAVRVIAPSKEASGLLEFDFDRAGDPDHNLASETWELTIFGSVTTNNSPAIIVTNPTTPDVYRWLGEQNSTIDIPGIYDSVPGTQAVVVR